MHLQQLRKAKFITNWTNKEDNLTKAGRAVLDEALDQAQHFLFNAIPVYDTEIQASEEAMKQTGMWRLPYPVTTFEFRATLETTNEGKTFKVVDAHGNRDFGLFIVVACEKTRNFDEVETKPYPDLIRWVVVRSAVTKHEWHLCGAVEWEDVRKHFAAMLVALHTRGIKRERWSGDKQVLVGRKEPANAYTRVLVREAVEAGHGTSEAGDRCRVRLHLRRGHVRQQPYGKGRALVRPRWIEPTLVGYEEEGVIEHEEYEV